MLNVFALFPCKAGGSPRRFLESGGACMSCDQLTSLVLYNSPMCDSLLTSIL